MLWNGGLSKDQSKVDNRILLRRAQQYCNTHQFNEAAKDYLLVLTQIEESFSHSSVSDLSKKRQLYLLVKEWLCHCYLQMQQPAEVLAHLNPPSEYTSLDFHYLRAQAYVQLNLIIDAIEELTASKQDIPQSYDLTWIESNLLLAGLYTKNQALSTAQTHLGICQSILESWFLNKSISASQYTNFHLEIYYHLSQIHRMNAKRDDAIKTLKQAHQFYQQSKVRLACDQNSNVSLISIISELFLLYIEQNNLQEALPLLEDLTLFEGMASACTIRVQAQALSALLMYAKHSYQLGNQLHASSAFRVALFYIGGVSSLENRPILVFSLIFAANFYLLPQHSNHQLALRFLDLANQRLSSLTQQEQDIIRLEILLLKLVALHGIDDMQGSTACFKELTSLYSEVQLNAPQKCQSLLEAILPLFSRPNIELFNSQITILELELQKFELALHSMMTLQSLISSHEIVSEDVAIAQSKEALLFSGSLTMDSATTSTPSSEITITLEDADLSSSSHKQNSTNRY